MVFIHDMIVSAINSLLARISWATVTWLRHDVLADGQLLQYSPPSEQVGE